MASQRGCRYKEFHGYAQSTLNDALLVTSLRSMKVQRSRELGTREKVEFLRRPRSYPGEGRRVELIETHFAWVFLTDSHAYKMKKPMRQDSMDYRTIAGRERGCRSEVRLNRRLAPSVYLGVVPLARKRDGSLVLGSGGRVVDWVVKMYRLPAARMLDRIIAMHAVTQRDRSALIQLLSAFYERVRRVPMSPPAYVAHLRSRTSLNRRELLKRDLGLNERIVEDVIRAQLEFIAREAALLRSRGSRLIEGHGDLRPEHIYLGSDGASVIDCLEFDPRLRRLDPIEEMAFLSLECMRRGASSLARGLLCGVRVAMADPAPDALAHFYISQRAVARAKIAAWHVRDPQYASHVRHWRARAASYLDDALHFSRLAFRESSFDASVLERHRPSMQKGSQRFSRQYSLHGLAV